MNLRGQPKSASAEASCLELSTETVASPIPIAVTVFLPKTTWPMVKGTRSQDGKRKRRRYTGKAVKNNVDAQMPIIKNEPTDEKFDVESSGSALDGVVGVPIIPMDLEVSAVPRSSSSTLGGCSRAAEVLVPHSSLHPADQGFVQKLGVTDYITLYYTLVADKVLPHGFLGDFLNLEPHVRRSSDRSLNFATSISDSRAEMLLEMQRKTIAGQCTSDSISHRSASGCG